MSGMTDNHSHRAAEHRSGAVVVLDDEPLVGQTIARIAAAAGFDARHAETSAAFFALLDERPADIVIIDLVLPDSDGVAVMERLAERPAPPKVIISSGVGSRVLDAARRVVSARGLPILGVLPKPFTQATLRELLLSRQVLPPEALKKVPDATSAPDRMDLAAAIERGDIQVVYQPRVACRTGTLEGFEALARWRHPEHGDIKPDFFVALAEQEGLIEALSRAVISQAIDWFAMLRSAETAARVGRDTLRRCSLSVNISALLLENNEFFDWMLARCRAQGIDAQQLVLEVTESSAMADIHGSLSVLTRLRVRGFRLSIDDFGTGFSTMMQLVRLPFSEIKLDKSFVLHSDSSEESATVVRSIVELGHNLKLNVVAEGVESPAVHQYLRELGCHAMQGYLISRPMAPEAIERWFVEREHQREVQRLEALYNSGLLDSRYEARFDRITRLTARLLEAPVSLISVIDGLRQWFKSRQGMALTQTPRSQAFCSVAIEDDGLLEVPDTLQHPLFSTYAAVRGDRPIRFYAGHVIMLAGGEKVGTLCVADYQPRTLSTRERQWLEALAGLVEDELQRAAVATERAPDDPRHPSGFRARATQLFDFCRRLEMPCGLLVARIRDIGGINHVHGRAKGDRLLDALQHMVTETGLSGDLAGRMRGREMALLIVNADEAAMRRSRALLSAAIDRYNRQYPDEPRLSCVLGDAIMVPGRADILEDLVALAHQQATPHDATT
ncbi:EAL domain-containing protein [Isoalcanivorax indicus]|uniref:EAL domain-containing protein n=1 Tax=Isoalcanivorax indicus TaxID=2202653 RepID=UPI000DB905B4|nr:EAL domain-containing protein [Isoalcanivorax indicus]